MPYVLLASPGAKQHCPNERRLLIAEQRRDRDAADLADDAASTGPIAGSSARGMPNASSSPSSQSSVREVHQQRAARVGRRRSRGRPPRCQASQLSIVPAASSPASARSRAPGDSSSSHASFGPEK